MSWYFYYLCKSQSIQDIFCMNILCAANKYTIPNFLSSLHFSL